jgi:hypothetical protein
MIFCADCRSSHFDSCIPLAMVFRVTKAAILGSAVAA